MVPQSAQFSGRQDIGVGTDDQLDGSSTNVAQSQRPSYKVRCSLSAGLERLTRYYASQGDLESFATSLAPSSKLAWYYADAFGLLDHKMKMNLLDEGQFSLNLEDSEVLGVAESVAYAKQQLGDPMRPLIGADIHKIIFSKNTEQLVALVIYIVAEQLELFPMFYESMSLYHFNREILRDYDSTESIQLDDRLLTGLVAVTVLLLNECHYQFLQWVFDVIQLGTKQLEYARVCQRQMLQDSSDMRDICITISHLIQRQSLEQIRIRQKKFLQYQPRVQAIAAQFRYYTEQSEMKTSMDTVLVTVMQSQAKDRNIKERQLLIWMMNGVKNSFNDHIEADTNLGADLEALENFFSIYADFWNLINVPKAGQVPLTLQRILQLEKFDESKPYYSMLLLGLQHKFVNQIVPPVSRTYQSEFNFTLLKILMKFFSAYWNAVSTNDVKEFSELSLITKLIPLENDNILLGPDQLTSLETVIGENVQPLQYPNLYRKFSLSRLVMYIATRQEATVETLMGVLLFCVQYDIQDGIDKFTGLIEKATGQSLDSVILSPSVDSSIESSQVKTTRSWLKPFGLLKADLPVASSERVDSGPFDQLKAYGSLSKFYESYKTANEQKQDTEVESAAQVQQLRDADKFDQTK
ncbi:hypothetical protein MIR68_003609 [Amoeboaphelidium protococcarum]|nr:hypothetical protein MIR68_003609 [Amoeboaphelidium protococcarum]